MCLSRKIVILGLVSLPVLVCSGPREQTLGPLEGGRPTFEITTDEAYDSSTVRAYSGDHGEIYAHIDEHLAEHLQNLQCWIRQPSVSTQNVGIREMARMLRDDLLRLGFREAAVAETSGHPGVWGFYDAGAEKTLVVYLMYDVQPVNPEKWMSPPFEARLLNNDLGRVLMGRGATNQKGPQRAFLNALESIIAVTGTLPVNLMVLAEGEEEMGSVHYPELVDQYLERLEGARGVFFPFNSQQPGGEVSMALGVKGIVYFELEAVGGSWGGPVRAEIHGSYKSIVDAPILRLAQALASLTTPDGNTILIPGYYDDVRPPTAEEQRLINGVVPKWKEDNLKRLLGVEQWIDGVSGKAAVIQHLYEVTLNVDGIWGGYTEAGVKTILPHRATAKVDSRLPPNVDPDRQLERIRHHLDSKGFHDIEVRKMEGYPASQTSVEAAIVQAAISVFNKYVDEVVVWPRMAGSAPFYQFTERLGLPFAYVGLGHGAGLHAPNEYMVIEPAEGSGVAGLAAVERGYVDFLFAFSEQD